MKLFLPSLITTLAVFPQVSESWSLGQRYYGLDVWSPRMLQKQQALMEKQQSLLQKAFSYTSPRYEIMNTEDTFQVSVDVPGVKPEDIDVVFENDRSVLSIRGSRSSTNEDESWSFTSQFSQSFSVNPSIDVENLTASLKNGVLVIAAPKDLKQIEENIRKIPVMVPGEEDATVTIDTPTPETQAQEVLEPKVEEAIEVEEE